MNFSYWRKVETETVVLLIESTAILNESLHYLRCKEQKALSSQETCFFAYGYQGNCRPLVLYFRIRELLSITQFSLNSIRCTS